MTVCASVVRLWTDAALTGGHERGLAGVGNVAEADKGEVRGDQRNADRFVNWTMSSECLGTHVVCSRENSPLASSQN